MNSDKLPQILQTGFHLTLGATSFLIETLQDPVKREENLGKLQSDLGLLADELLEKGEMTDREARNFVDTIFSTPADVDRTEGEPPATPRESGVPEAQQEIQELTELMAALRAQLENLDTETPED